MSTQVQQTEPSGQANSAAQDSRPSTVPCAESITPDREPLSFSKDARSDLEPLSRPCAGRRAESVTPDQTERSEGVEGGARSAPGCGRGDQGIDLAILKQRKLALMRRKLELVKGFGLAYYRPFPVQDKFHRAGDFKRRMFRAGNRTGKSECGCAEDCSWMMGYRPYYPVGDPARHLGIPGRPVKGLVITTDWDKVDEIWTSERGDVPGKLWKLLPKDYVKSKRRNHSGAIDMVEGENGSVLRFDTVKSFMANPMGSESSAWDFIHVDEPCPEAMWKAASRGLVDTDGSAWFTLTALSEPWICDMFFPKDLRGKETLEPIIKGDRKVSWAINGTIYDNLSLTKEAIQTYADSLTEDEKQCRLYGIPLHLSGLIYKQFDYDKHVLKDVPHGWVDFMSPPKNYTLYYAIDPHPQTPHAVLFCWVSPHGQKFFCAEIFEHCTIQELSQRILGITNDYYVCRAKCDPLAYINDPITDSNMADEFAVNGVYLEKATKALQHGILHAQQELLKDGNIFFGPHMRRAIWEFQHYTWDPKENKPIDKDDHMMENFYRLLLDDMTHVSQEAPSNDIDEIDVPSANIDEFNDELVTDKEEE